jgi:hypothetical protein
LHFRFLFPELLVYAVDLGGFQDIPDHEEFGAELVAHGDDFFEFPGSNVRGVIGRIPLLHALYHGNSAVRRNEALEFRHSGFEVFLQDVLSGRCRR